jgi:hypothetical protein
MEKFHTACTKMGGASILMSINSSIDMCCITKMVGTSRSFDLLRWFGLGA